MKHKDTDPAERRKYPRINKRIPFKLQTDEGIVSAETINLSGNGVYCRVDQYIPVMTQLRIVFALIYDNDAAEVAYVECEGIVVRVEDISPENDLWHIAVFFNEIEDSEKNKIMNFIAKDQ
jgi:c-di-GMP-binding flagellar brake protein YcgR